MFAMRSEIYADNRVSVHRYLDMVWKKICTLASSFNPTRLSSALRERFQDYVDAEEARLREGLVQVKYRIDAPNTLSLILGEGRVEKVGVAFHVEAVTRWIDPAFRCSLSCLSYISF